MTEPDDRLLEPARRGDEAAFERLFLRYYETVYRVLYGVMGRREEAEDVAQETFLELYRNPPRIEEDGTVRAWLCRVALNRGYNALRGERRARERGERASAEACETGGDPESQVLRAEDQARVRHALAQLPSRQRELLLLRHAGLSYAEVTTILEVAPGSVGTLLVRAQRAFTKVYREMKPEEDAATPNEVKP